MLYSTEIKLENYIIDIDFDTETKDFSYEVRYLAKSTTKTKEVISEKETKSNNEKHGKQSNTDDGEL